MARRRFRAVVASSIGWSAVLGCGEVLSVTEGPPPAAEAGTSEPGGADASLDASANPDVIEAGADVLDPEIAGRKRVFITRAQSKGSFLKDGGPDDFCAQATAQVGAGGSFTAYLSFGAMGAVDRLKGEGPWYSMDRSTLLFDGKGEVKLWPRAAIDQDERAEAVPEPTEYWTGTEAVGHPSGWDCQSWTYEDIGGGSIGGTVGRSDQKTNGWTDLTRITCNSLAHFLCFED